MIELDAVSKVFGAGPAAVRAIDRLSFRCPAGQFWSFVGPSGSGKSTILHLIAGLTPPTEGRVIVDGQEVPRMSGAKAAELRRRKIGYILQSFNLLPFLSVAENVGLPLVLDGVAAAEIDRRVREALTTVGLSRRASDRPAYLSGGQQQRVAIARALVIRPTIILADEPTGNLDRTSGRAIIDVLQDINEETGVTIFLVTHDPVFAAYAHRVLRLVDGSLQHDIELGEPAHVVASIVEAGSP